MSQNKKLKEQVEKLTQEKHKKLESARKEINEQNKKLTAKLLKASQQEEIDEVEHEVENFSKRNLDLGTSIR